MYLSARALNNDMHAEYSEFRRINLNRSDLRVLLINRKANVDSRIEQRVRRRDPKFRKPVIEMLTQNIRESRALDRQYFANGDSDSIPDLIPRYSTPVLRSVQKVQERPSQLQDSETTSVQDYTLSQQYVAPVDARSADSGSEISV